VNHVGLGHQVFLYESGRKAPDIPLCYGFASAIYGNTFSFGVSLTADFENDYSPVLLMVHPCAGSGLGCRWHRFYSVSVAKPTNSAK
jgi:hypothetical protein